MHKNFLWQAFLVFVLSVTLAYSGMALYRYYAYTRLTSSVESTSSLQWHVVKKSADAYYLDADYTFMVDGQLYHGQMSWKEDLYLNAYAAENGGKENAAKRFKVWYDPAHPAHSALEKHFPFKESLSAIFLWGLFFYFLWLGFYVTKFKT